MNLSAAALRLMAEKGLTLDDVAEIVAANECRDPTNAQRQARFRAKKAESNGVTVTANGSPNERDNLTPQLPPNVISSEITPPVENSEIELKPEHVVEVWNDLAGKHGLPVVKKITPERRKKLNTFIRRHTIDDITEAISAIPRSPFLLGQNQRGWQASFDWFLEPRNLTKLTEGTYVH